MHNSIAGPISKASKIHISIFPKKKEETIFYFMQIAFVSWPLSIFINCVNITDLTMVKNNTEYNF